MDRYDYFPTSIFRSEQPQWVSESLNFFDQAILKVIQSENLDPNQKVIQSYNLVGLGILSPVFQFFQESSQQILASQGYDMQRHNVNLTEMWAQEIKPLGFNDVHLHGNSQVSGFYFLETPENGSYPVFYDPRYEKQMSELPHVPTEEVTYSTNAIHFNNIKPGTFLIFNSWVKHNLVINQSNQLTKCIHFIARHSQ